MLTKDLYKSVTADIIQQLEEGTPPWVMPWKQGGFSPLIPQNASNGNRYSGINISILWDACIKRGYKENRWLTYKQAAAHGGHVRKGEKGVPVVFVKSHEVDGEDGQTEKKFFTRVYTVFNIAQIDGLSDVPDATEVLYDGPEFFRGMTAKVVFGKTDMAYFNVNSDTIYMPPKEAFETPAHYHATMLHELIHWTGHSSRLNRFDDEVDGKDHYAFEELVAEMGSAYLCAYLGLEGQLRHASYIEAWQGELADSDRAIFIAASKASRAADYLIELAFHSAESEAA